MIVPLNVDYSPKPLLNKSETLEFFYKKRNGKSPFTMCVPWMVSDLLKVPVQDAVYLLSKARAEVEGTGRVTLGWKQDVYLSVLKDLLGPEIDCHHNGRILKVPAFLQNNPVYKSGWYLARGSGHLFSIRDGSVFCVQHPTGANPEIMKKPCKVHQAWEIKR